nr:NADH-quinone oxidoreductase subunit I [candidate division Zixibacteria bacterium]
MVKEVLNGIKNLLIGLMTTGKHLGKHAITLQYPKEKWPMPERSRGVVVLLSDPDTGELNCTVCLLCMRSCPSAAIRIEHHKNEETKKRVLDDFIVDNTICCFCGLCEEACNFAAIKLAPKYEFSTYNQEDLIYHTARLQELGRDVPYEKPARKKAAAAVPRPVPKPAGQTDKPVEVDKKPDVTSDAGAAGEVTGEKKAEDQGAEEQK